MLRMKKCVDVAFPESSQALICVCKQKHRFWQSTERKEAKLSTGRTQERKGAKHRKGKEQTKAQERKGAKQRTGEERSKAENRRGQQENQEDNKRTVRGQQEVQ